jgi:hypothetical protein
MNLKQTLLALSLAFATSVAFAFQCPGDMKTIDEALAQNPEITAEQRAEVERYRAEGEELHKAGRHQESVDTLAKALEILGL